MADAPDVAIIVNPAAGRGRSRAVGTALQARLAMLGADARVIQPLPGRTSRAAREAAAQGAEVVVACGGDGTVHQVLQGVCGSGAALAIAPSGTGNDIASVVHAGRVSVERMAGAILHRRRRAIDVGSAQGESGTEYFLGVLSTGFDSTVNERANAMRWPGGRARYLAGVAIELPRFSAREYEVDLDGETYRGRALLVCVANAGTYGGGMRVCPDARVDDAQLDITWVDDIAKADFLRVLPSVFSGAHVRHPAVRTMRCRRASIRAHGQVAYADGERLGPLPVDVCVQPGALHVVDVAVA